MFPVRSVLIQILITPLWLLVIGPAQAAVDQAFDKKPIVFVTPAVQSEFSDTVAYPARVRSKINAWTTAESAGQVQKIAKPVGSRVRRGDVVLIVQNIDPVFRYAAVKILSPAAGFITSLDVDLLSGVERGDKLFSVTDPSSLVVETEIPAADHHFFKIGDKGSLKDQAGKEYPVVIQALSPAVDMKTGTANALLIFNGDKSSKGTAQKLSQGELGQVLFHINPRKSFILPESALVLKGGATFVRILDGKKAKLIPITVSLDLGDKFEIQAGLTDGEQVITRWSHFITDDEEVEVQQPDKTQL